MVLKVWHGANHLMQVFNQISIPRLSICSKTLKSGIIMLSVTQSQIYLLPNFENNEVKKLQNIFSYVIDIQSILLILSLKSLKL